MALLEGGGDTGTQNREESGERAGEPKGAQGLPEWTQALPEDLRTQSLGKFKPGEKGELVPMPVSLAKSYTELEKKLGAGAGDAALPDEKDTEGWGKLWSRLGRPDKPGGYQLEGLPEVQVDPAFEESYRSVAHQLGLTQKQAQGLNLWTAQVVAEQQAAQRKAQEAEVSGAEAALKEQWGTMRFSYNLAVANQGLKVFAGDKVAQVLKERGLDSHPVIVDLFYRIGKELSEDALKGIEVSGSGEVTTVTREKLEEMMKDPRYGKDQAYTRKVSDGFKALYPGEHVLAPTSKR